MNRTRSPELSSNALTRVGWVLGATPTHWVELEGGEVGTVYRIEFEDHAPVALKTGSTPLRIEGKMLRYLDRETPLPVPTVHHVESDLLVMEFVDGDGRAGESAAHHAAELLVALHEQSTSAFGFEFATLSGPYWQPNRWRDSWIEFFRDARLRQFAVRARAEGTLPQPYYHRVEQLAMQLEDHLIEPSSPSLVHGDFHAANLVFDEGRVECVLDPALYFGHDELELAYLDYAGSFGEAILDRYYELRDVSPGFFTRRRHVYKVFHILENVRFFGRELLGDLDRALDRVGL